MQDPAGYRVFVQKLNHVFGIEHWETLPED